MVIRIPEAVRSWARSDVPQRAIRTFVQTFVAVFVVTDLSTARNTAAAAVAAGVSAVYNRVIRPWLDRRFPEAE